MKKIFFIAMLFALVMVASAPVEEKIKVEPTVQHSAGWSGFAEVSEKYTNPK